MRPALVLALLLASCDPGVSIGARCERSSECGDPLVCLLGRCRTECTTHRDCPLDAICLLDDADRGSCALPDDPGCDDPGETCAPGLACAGGACVNACASLAECPGGSQCVAGDDGLARCVRDDADAGVPIDAHDEPDGGACPLPDCDRAVEVAVAYQSSCVRTEAGRVWCWGGVPQIGRSPYPAICEPLENACSPAPVRALVDEGAGPVELEGVTDIASSDRVLCVVARQRAYCWGSLFTDTLGRPGDGDVARAVRLDPGDMLLPAEIATVLVGTGSAMALRANGSGWGWGDNRWSQHALPASPGQLYGVPVDPLPRATLLRYGASHGCGLRDGRVWCWGENDVGQAGGAVVGVDAHLESAAEVPGLPDDDATDVAPGRSSSCALVEDDVWCWGNRANLGTVIDPSGCRDGADRLVCPPTRVTRLGAPFRSLAVSTLANAACAIDADGRVLCWGEGNPVHPGSGREPAPIAGLPPPSQVAIVDGHGCAVADGDVWCWGENDLGQLGRGTITTGVTHVAERVVWP